MKYTIRVQNKRTGVSYYFVKLVQSGGVIRPRNCMLYRRNEATCFDTIQDACSVIKQIDPKVWSCLIRPTCNILPVEGR